MKNYLSGVWNAIRGKRTKPQDQRSYKNVLGVGGAYSDWALSFLTEDGDLWQNIAVLRDRSRDLFKTDCYFQKYQMELEANVFGESGIRLRMKVKEEADRVVYAPDEKGFMESEAQRLERLRDFVNRKMQRDGGFTIGGALFRQGYDRAKSTIQAGAIDLYACRIIEEKYREWQRKEFCTMAGGLTYNEVRRIRLISCARDGEYFIRMVRGKNVNKFGFSLQLINAEWCDSNLNVADTGRGTSIRMGIELDKWGRKVAFHFIKQSASAWQWGMPGYTLAASMQGHEVIPAEDIIHYMRAPYGDSTRGAPWSASVIPKSRQLDKFEEAEVIAARVAACKMGFLVSDMRPEGGHDFSPPNPNDKPPGWDATAGGIQPLNWGVKFQEWNPNHPTQNFDQFRRGMLRSWCAGLPGADYNVIANDLENINFSAGRLGRLDTNEMWKLLQRFDIENAERPIFEAWLDMALLTGAVPLPYAKFDKFNKPHFSGRRWAGVDPIKETQAAVLAIQNKLMSYGQWYDEQAQDLEETWEEIAQEEMLAEELGITLPSALELQIAMAASSPSDDEDKPKKKPADKMNGRHVSLTH